MTKQMAKNDLFHAIVKDGYDKIKLYNKSMKLKKDDLAKCYEMEQKKDGQGLEMLIHLTTKLKKYKGKRPYKESWQDRQAYREYLGL